jgi:hypothetical protein
MSWLSVAVPRAWPPLHVLLSLVFEWELLTTTRVSGDKSGGERLKTMKVKTRHDGPSACKLREL